MKLNITVRDVLTLKETAQFLRELSGGPKTVAQALKNLPGLRRRLRNSSDLLWDLYGDLRELGLEVEVEQANG